MFLLVLFCFFRRRKQIFQTLRRKDTEFFFFRTQITQIKGICSLTLVIDIPKIPKICG